MPYYTEEQIKQARLIDLMTYLQTYEPTELVHVRGNTWCLREHDSLKVTADGKWYWWSRGFGGYSALDYLTKVKGLPFIKAMDILTDDSKDFQFETPRIFNRDNSSTERKLCASGCRLTLFSHDSVVLSILFRYQIGFALQEEWSDAGRV